MVDEQRPDAIAGTEEPGGGSPMGGSIAMGPVETELCDAEARISWHNVDDEILRNHISRLNTSCSSSFVCSGLAKPLAHGEQRFMRPSSDCGEQRSLSPSEPARASSDYAEDSAQSLAGSNSPADRPHAVEKRKSGREMWLEEQRAMELDRPAVLVMGTVPMCTAGGCGYFSDDDK